MKVCIFVKGASNRGKTTTIKALARLIWPSVDVDLMAEQPQEIRYCHSWNGIPVALCSKGDPGSDSLKWIKVTAIEQNHCEIIVAACRRGGSTQDPILPYLQENGYTIIEVYPSMIKIPCNQQPDYKILAQALAQQILYIMTNRNKLFFIDKLQEK